MDKQKKESWNQGRLYKDSQSGKVYGHLTFFINSENVNLGKITVKETEQEVGRIFGSGHYSKGVGIEYAIGEKFVNEQKYANISVTLQRFALQSYQKLGLTKGDVIRVSGIFQPNEYDDAQGVKRYNVNCLCDTIEVVYMKKRDGQAPQQASTPKPQEVEDDYGLKDVKEENPFENGFDVMEDDIQF